MEKSEFKFMGVTVEKVSVSYGIFLIIFGILISLLSNSNSLTSYIPTFFGLPIYIFGYLSIRYPEKKKLFMHIIVLIGFIVFLGGLDFLRGYPDFFENFWADISKLTLLISGLIFTYINIQSFIYIRKNR
tara:strand:- start:2399 stop:2788 length:390 start_codon:yes stop_codon:yes gene_type:complete